MKGTGPCSDPFYGSECEYFPEFAINVRFAPACCDATGCLCECVYQCATRPQITTLLESSLINHEFHGCNARAKSEEEGEKWRGGL